mmetsp:Transcript_29462/g.28607  ORF Transcript_29462/g.28607 Transcript_29462/m.28607 type:complete len:223 (-) Transcript_29462:1918-2586(-)
MVECDGPVLTEELGHVGDDPPFVPGGQRVQVVFMQAHETPQALQDHILIPHIGDRVYEADAVEGELDEVAFALVREVVTLEVLPVLDLHHPRLQHQWVGGADVVVDEAAREDAALALWEVEGGEFLLHGASFLALVPHGRVINVEDAPGEAGAHLSAIVAVHPQRPALGERLVPPTELTQAPCSKDGWVRGLEVLVHYQAAIVDEPIVVDGMEHILVHVPVA